MNIKHKFKALATGFILGVCVATSVYADDIEIYTSGALGAPTIQPNVMFIIDTSGSMGAKVADAPVPYDYTVTYAGSYDPSYIYFSTDGHTPSSSLKYSFLATSNTCDNSVETYDKGVVIDTVGPLQKYGHYSDQIAQFSSNKWHAMNTTNTNSTQRSYLVECAADAGIHGQTAASSDKWIIDSSAGWTGSATNPPVWNNGANVLYLFSGNYLNYKTGGASTTSVSRLDVVKAAVNNIVATYNNINICLMQYDSANAEGGAIMYPCLDVKASRNDFYSRLKTMTASGYTPLSETYYEALLYFGGKAVDYGKTANPSNQTGSTETGNPKFYQTPISDVCQKNYIVYLTDGAPTYDYLSNTRQTALASTFPAGSCDAAPASATDFSSNRDAFSSATATDDNCLDELSGWAKNNDVAERTDIAAFDGKQTITTYTVGFGSDVQGDADAVRLLQDTATEGGGKFYTATDATSLDGVFSDIVAEILKINSTFTSPAVSVNAYNRATNLDDLYFTLFQPANGPHWNGNLKKFKLDFDASNNPFIADSTGVDAVDATTGFFKDTSISYWTAAADAPDGADPALGGAASRLTLPTDTAPRKVYTYTGTYTNTSGVMSPSTTAAGDLTSSANLLSQSNSSITDAMLGGVATNPNVTYTYNGTSTTSTYQTAMLMWAQGYDILGSEANKARRIMGDPLHAQPALVQYGLTGTGDPDLVAYVATNDGYLHAFNSLTGSEYFSFVPQELLPNLSKIFNDNAASGKSYGLDGDVVAWINDVGHDGAIGTGDTVYLYFGQRRGGRNIYSMDVTDRTNPKLRWMIEGGVGDFAELGQTWSTPDVVKLKLAGADREVLIFGAGYDTLQDGVTVRTPDTVGRGIYIVDALTGQMLWRVGPDTGANTQMTDMKYSIPGRITALDMDGDGYVDRLYAGDMGGQLWRFDIKTSDTSSNLSTLITGGRIADLAVDSDSTAARRFYYPPDVGLIAEPGKPPYLAVVAVSGYRAHPLNTTIHDRAYMIRDTDVYNKPADSDYATKMVTEADLYDTTSNLIGGGNGTTTPTATQQQTAAASLQSAQGWYINLQETDGSWIGEKGLSEPLILNGSAIFTTYIPAAVGPTSSSCTPNAGTGSAYYVQVTDGTPTYHTGTVGTAPERKIYLTRTGIPPSPNVIVTDKGVATLCVGAECSKAGVSNTVEKSYWYEQEQ